MARHTCSDTEPCIDEAAITKLVRADRPIFSHTRKLKSIGVQMKPTATCNTDFIQFLFNRIFIWPWILSVYPRVVDKCHAFIRHGTSSCLHVCVSCCGSVRQRWFRSSRQYWRWRWGPNFGLLRVGGARGVNVNSPAVRSFALVYRGQARRGKHGQSRKYKRQNHWVRLTTQPSVAK